MSRANLRLVSAAEAPAPVPQPKRDKTGDGSSSPHAHNATLKALPDDGLVALARNGDKAAAEQLYRRHARFAINLATRIAGSTTDVEDVVHDAFIKAFDNLSKLRNPKVFRAWLGSIVVYAMRSRLRRSRAVQLFGLGRGGDPIDIDCIASDHASPQARAELAQVYALLQTLPVNDRIAWTLRMVEGHELRATAQLAGCSLATIKRRILRAQRYIDHHFVRAAAPAASADDTSGDKRDRQAPQSARRGTPTP